MKILAIDPDEHVLRAIATAFELQRPGTTLIPARTAEAGLTRFLEDEPDVVILEIALPDKNGFLVVKELRSISDIPIVVLTGRADDRDLIEALDLGADHYIVKPLGHMELLAKVNAVLRRWEPMTGSNGLGEFVAGDLRVSFHERRVTLRGEQVSLTALEYKLLYHLVRNAGRVVPHRALVNRVWGDEGEARGLELRTLVLRLRMKIEPTRDSPSLIQNYRGLGYRFQPPRDPRPMEDRVADARRGTARS